MPDYEFQQDISWAISKEKFDKLFAMNENQEPLEWACADCGTEKAHREGVCGNCKSVRIVLVSMIEQLMGSDWREKFEPTDDPVTTDHPDYKKAVEHIAAVEAEMRPQPQSFEDMLDVLGIKR